MSTRTQQLTVDDIHLIHQAEGTSPVNWQHIDKLIRKAQTAEGVKRLRAIRSKKARHEEYYNGHL